MTSNPDSDWTLRPFQLGDAPAARWLIESVWREHFHLHPDPLVRDFIYTRLSDVDKAETAYSEGSLFLCAIVRDEIVGTGAVKRSNNQECELARMFVASAYRGRGIGWAIAEKLIVFARATAYDRIRLSSNFSLVASHRMYEKLGFRPEPAWEPNGETHSRYYALKLSNS